MTRSEALDLIKNKIKNANLIKHCLAVEAVMTGLASKLGQDLDIWAMAGLLHDIDYEETKDDLENHALKGSEMLADLGLDNEIVQAVKKHNPMLKLDRETEIEKALFCADPVTGLIIASALVLPSKKLADVSKETVLKRFKEKRFAEGANREAIASCKELGLSLEEFIEIALTYMQMMSLDLGL